MAHVKRKIREELTVANAEQPHVRYGERWNTCAPIVDRAITQAFEQAQEMWLQELSPPLIMERVVQPDVIHGVTTGSRLLIHMTVTWNTIDYAYYATQNMRGLAYDQQALSFNAYCLDDKTYEYVNRSEAFLELNVRAIKLSDDVTGHGSEQHGLAINAALPQFDKNSHNLIADTDMVIVVAGWDETLRATLGTHDVFSVAFQRPFSEAVERYYENRPTVSWLAFKVGTDVKGLDVSPLKERHLSIDTPSLSMAYGLPIGSAMICDTGWRLPVFLIDHGLTHLSLSEVETSIVFRPGSTYVEYHYDRTPYIVHMLRSAKLPFRMSQRSRDFYDACERYLQANQVTTRKPSAPADAPNP